MSVKLDPNVKANLLNVLFNIQDKEKASIKMIGTKDQLDTVVKLTSSEKVTSCFRQADQSPYKYPKLLERCCLVACVDRYIEVQVFAVYTLEHMKEMHAKKGSGAVRDMSWRILEIPEELASELLNSIALEPGSGDEHHNVMILTTKDLIEERK